MELLDYVQSGVLAVFQGPAAFTVLGVSVSITICMIFSGFICGILVGATPGLSGAFAMAVSLPILISVFEVGFIEGFFWTFVIFMKSIFSS